MQIQDFGLSFGSDFNDLKTDAPSGRYVLFANGVPWYEIRDLGTGFIVSVSAKMAARQNAGLHPMLQDKDKKITKCIVDVGRQSLKERMMTVSHVVEQRLGRYSNQPLLDAIAYWLDNLDAPVEAAAVIESTGELPAEVPSIVVSSRVIFAQS